MDFTSKNVLLQWNTPEQSEVKRPSLSALLVYIWSHVHAGKCPLLLLHRNKKRTHPPDEGAWPRTWTQLWVDWPAVCWPPAGSTPWWPGRSRHPSYTGATWPLHPLWWCSVHTGLHSHTKPKEGERINRGNNQQPGSKRNLQPDETKTHVTDGWQK